MKTRACRNGWKAVAAAGIAVLSLGAGAALADGEPTDPDAVPQVPLRCPEDPESGLPGAEWIGEAGGGLAEAAARVVVLIATL